MTAWLRSLLSITRSNSHSGAQLRPATLVDEQATYEAAPSFISLLPWAEYLDEHQCMLLDDGRSVAAFFELEQLPTEGREADWLTRMRDSVEHVLQDSFEEHDQNPWIVQMYVQDEASWEQYLLSLRSYPQPRAKETAFTRCYLQLFEHHLRAISKVGGLFLDTAVTQLAWRAQTRRVRLVIYRRSRHTVDGQHRSATPEQELAAACDRFAGGLSTAGLRVHRLKENQIHDWLLRWFNPRPRSLGPEDGARGRFYELAALAQETAAEELPLASGTDFAERLFFTQPRSDAATGQWYFDELPHQVVVVDRLRSAPEIGHLTGELRRSGDALNTMLDQLPDETIACITMVVAPQDRLEAHLHYLGRKSVGDTLDSEQTREDVRQARGFIGRSHKLYRGSIAFYLRGADQKHLDERATRLNNVLLSAGLQPVRGEVAALTSYLRWLPGVFDPSKDKREVYTQLMFCQHLANLMPLWGRASGTGHPGITMFTRGGGPVTVDPMNPKDRRLSAHMLIIGPTGSGKSATLTNLLTQATAMYRPRIIVIEVGNSFGLFGSFAQRLGLSVHRVRFAAGSTNCLAPFADAWRLVKTPDKVKTLDAEAVDESDLDQAEPETDDEPRDVLGELEICARLMITGAEQLEDSRMTRADRSVIRQCIIDAAHTQTRLNRMVLPEHVRDALRRHASDAPLPEPRRNRVLEMADAMDIFCQGTDGQMFNSPGQMWPEADITIVDLAMFARDGYAAQLSIAYLSLLSAVNHIAERDQYLGRPGIFAVDETHIVVRHPLLMRPSAKATKMYRKLSWWIWLSTQGLDDFPPEAEVMLSMMEWWWCLSMPPDEVDKIARFRTLTPAQRALLLSARKEPGKFTEGVVLSASNEILFRAVPPSLFLALGMTEGEEKHARHKLMREHGVDELGAALMMAANIDRMRGIDPFPLDEFL